MSLGLLVFSFFSGKLFQPDHHPSRPGQHDASRAERRAAGDLALAAVERELNDQASEDRWVGEYWGGPRILGHPSLHLRLGSRHYAVLELTDVFIGDERGYGEGHNQFLQEWGEVRRNGEYIALAAEERSAGGLSGELVWVDRGSVAHLMAVEAIPSLYYPPRVWSPPSGTGGIPMLTRDGEHAYLAPRPTSVPEAYNTARAGEPHLRVLERIAPHGERTAWRVALHLAEGVRVELEQPVWWDAEPCTLVHGFVESLEPGRAIAAIDLPEGFEAERITIGSTFSRLPRLE